MKKNMLYVILYAILSATFMFGCASVSDRHATDSNREAIEIANENTLNIPSDSPFSKIKVGMGMRQVTDLIGHSNDSSVYSTGKAFIPFYFGTDTVRHVFYYKNQGRIITSNDRVVKIEYDPTEDGYK